VTGANRHDMKKQAALLDATVIAPTTVDHLVLDRGYDYPTCREAAVTCQSWNRSERSHYPSKWMDLRHLPIQQAIVRD